MANVRRELLEDVAKIHAEGREHAGDDPAAEQLRGRTLRRLGLIYDVLDRPGQAEQLHREALTVSTRLHEAYPDEPGYAQDRAHDHHNLALNLHTQAVVRRGRTTRLTKDPAKAAEAETHGRTAAGLRRDLIARQPNEPGHRMDLSKHLNNLGRVLRDLGRFAEAEEAHAEAVVVVAPAIEAHPRNNGNRDILATNHFNLGALFETLAERKSSALDRDVCLARAETNYRRAVEERRVIAASPGRPRDARSDLARDLDSLAHLLQTRGQYGEAEKAFAEARDEMQAQVAEFPGVPVYQKDLGAAMNNLANLHLNRKRWADAIPLLRQAVRYQEAVYRLNTGDANVRTLLCNHYGALTEALVGLGDHAAAATSAEQLVRLNPGDPRDPYFAARFLARCVGLAAADRNLDPAGRQAKQSAYADQAMKYLAQALKNGFQDVPKYVARVEGRPLEHRDLDSIRGTPEFRQLTAELKAAADKASK